ncbi:hypothetical protein SAMN05660776_2062 [Salegentibacter holothuriorum]|uniref:Uncharacterized protein n=1 Tax=Salegentibacter holothuriorum TaxID=241145 RepID=A0A1T5CMI0_9FLAO|nr:hypothetical protein [Salegentibacter holothuriorum]SKB60715.1 hypothetical protein SAMN05660776_2062 [Salegentibacter holothuriorum]
MKSARENKTDTAKNTKTSSPVAEENKPKNTFAKFFSKVGYSIWMVVMIVGGVIAFLVSLFLL